MDFKLRSGQFKSEELLMMVMDTKVLIGEMYLKNCLTQND